jgi:hypothetical protein
MRDVVLSGWIAFTEGFEGGIPWLYLDRAGAVTVAYGNLVNTPSAVLNLPLVHADGSPATKAEIAVAWQRVHADPNAAIAGAGYAKRLTDLRLTREGMTDLALARLHLNNADLVRQLPDFEEFPACAQMALHSWGWACGTRARFPKMMAALKERDFDTAAVEIFMDENLRAPDGRYLFDANGQHVKNGGLVPRNVANRILMRNASRVQAFKLDPDLIEWRVDLGVAEAETQPELPPCSES